MKKLVLAILIVVLAVILFHIFSTHIHRDKTPPKVTDKAMQQLETTKHELKAEGHKLKQDAHKLKEDAHQLTHSNAN